MISSGTSRKEGNTPPNLLTKPDSSEKHLLPFAHRLGKFRAHPRLSPLLA
jgi:hypothetical protein